MDDDDELEQEPAWSMITMTMAMMVTMMVCPFGDDDVDDYGGYDGGE